MKLTEQVSVIVKENISDFQRLASKQKFWLAASKLTLATALALTL